MNFILFALYLNFIHPCWEYPWVVSVGDSVYGRRRSESLLRPVKEVSVKKSRYFFLLRPSFTFNLKLISRTKINNLKIYIFKNNLTFLWRTSYEYGPCEWKAWRKIGQRTKNICKNFAKLKIFVLNFSAFL